MRWRNPSGVAGLPGGAVARSARWEISPVPQFYGAYPVEAGLAVEGNGTTAWRTFQLPVARQSAQAGRVWYVRAQAYDENERPLGPPSNTIELRVLPPDEGPPLVDLRPPVVRVEAFEGYRYAACPDAANRFVVTRRDPVACSDDALVPLPEALCTPGHRFRQPPDDDDCGFLPDVVCDVAEGAVALARSIIDEVSSRYDDLKARADALARDLASSIPGCDARCGALAVVALDAALVSAGIPPSLPDFDALVEEGFAALVDECAAAVGEALPPAVGRVGARAACEAGMDALRQAAAEARAAATPTFAPDPAYQPRLARLYL